MEFKKILTITMEILNTKVLKILDIYLMKKIFIMTLRILNIYLMEVKIIMKTKILKEMLIMLKKSRKIKLKQYTKNLHLNQ